MCKKIVCLMTLILMLGLSSTALATTYYVSPSGNDNNSGTSPEQAWQTTDKVNSMTFSAGDSILFEGGQTFSGGLVFTSSGTPTSPITVSSYGTGRATINSDFEEIGIHVIDCGGFEVRDLIFVGSGNTGTNSSDDFVGVKFNNTTGTRLEYIRADNLDVSGYRGKGILLDSDQDTGGFRDVEVTNCVVHDIGKEGINSVVPKWPVKSDTYEDVYIGDCVAYNVTGVPGVTPHSGSGIVFGGINGAVIEFCEAYDTGRNCDADGGGPVGIWCWECVNMTFQFNESHHNKTAGGDGGGFDLDGGTSFSTMQYNYAHDNQGGNLLMQFSRSRYAGDNIFRYNVVANDAIGSRGPMGLITFYSDATLNRTDVYNNTLYVGPDSREGAIAIWVWHGQYNNINLRNNIFISEPDKSTIVADKTGGFTFQNNVYWAGGSPLEIDWDGPIYTSLDEFRTATGQEMLDGQPVGLEVDPQLVDVSDHPVLGPHNLANLSGYKLTQYSACIDYGLDLATLFGMDVGTRDYYGNTIPQGSAYDIGAHSYPGGGTPDTTAPTPDPMTFATAPYAIGDNAVKMIASTASDVSGVEYFFDCVSGAGNDSRWQASTTYTDTGLTPSTQYGYQVKARDKSYNQNETAPSTTQLVTTNPPDTTAPTPDPMTFVTSPYGTGFTTIAMEATTASDESGGDVEYYFACTTAGGHDSSWQESTFYEDSGLEPSTSYTYQVKARDTSTNLNETAYSTAETGTTNTYTGSTVFSDGFESGDFAAGGWSTSGTVIEVTSEAAYTGNYGAKLGKKGCMEKALSTEGLTNIRIKYMRGLLYSDSKLTVLWDDGSDTHIIENLDGEYPWELVDVFCGPSADNNPNFRLSFKNSNPGPANNYAYVDDVEIMGEGEPDVNAPTPDPMTWATVPYATGSTSIAMVATTASDPSGVEYYFDCTTTGGHDSSWQAGTSYEDTGLDPSTQYCYKVQARDKSPNQNATGWSTTECATTQEPGAEIYVYDIAMSSYESKSGYYVATATMWIKDVSLNDISGATVTGAWSGATDKGDTSGDTGADGKVTLESKAVKGGGTYTFTVTDVSATGYTYNPLLNNMDSNSITAP